MAENAVVRARINEHIKEEAATVLATMGLTISDAFRMMLIYRKPSDEVLQLVRLGSHSELGL
ncbi:MAG: hypothetical protein GXP22_07180 [Gammaproteobacteria bacterium]|nr:hypothetical protein [Gammaproteobacteria bacterium]